MLHHAKQGCFGRLTVRAPCYTRNIFQNPSTFREIAIFTCFWVVLYEGSMEGVWLGNANLLSAISVSGRLFARRGKFLKKCKGLITYYALFGQLASRRVRSGRCNIIFQVSNRTIRCILKRSARLYGDCMEPDHMAKYSTSLPMLTDLSENLI